jgi:hypothetical protein
MAADFIDDFETNFPGVKAAFNVRAYCTWSSGALRSGNRCAAEIRHLAGWRRAARVAFWMARRPA